MWVLTCFQQESALYFGSNRSFSTAELKSALWEKSEMSLLDMGFTVGSHIRISPVCKSVREIPGYAAGFYHRSAMDFSFV